MEIRFIPYSGSTDNLITSENCLNFKWTDPDCKVLFSVTRQGNAATCNLSSDRNGLRKLETALNEWCDFCFWLFDWCEAILGIIEKRSVLRLAQKCNFIHDGIIKGKHICIRRK